MEIHGLVTAVEPHLPGKVKVIFDHEQEKFLILPAWLGIEVGDRLHEDGRLEKKESGDD